MNDVADAKYISLTTFTREGAPKATPVWITGAGGALRFYTGADSWKVKRLRNDSSVEVRVCDMRGRVEPHAEVYLGTGRVLDDDESLTEVKDAVLAKYGWAARLVRVSDAVKDRLGRGDDAIAVQIDLVAQD